MSDKKQSDTDETIVGNGSVYMSIDVSIGSATFLSMCETTKYRNGTQLIVEVTNLKALQEGDEMEIALCDERHVHLNITLQEEFGMSSALVVVAYAIGLAMDRLEWKDTDKNPTRQDVDKAFEDCLAEFVSAGKGAYASWLQRYGSQKIQQILSFWEQLDENDSSSDHDVN